MVKFYAMRPKSRKLEDLDTVEKGCWIHIENPTDSEIAMAVKETGIPEGFIRSPLDEEESSRIEQEDGFTLIIVDIPISECSEESYGYSTLPIGIILGSEHFVTVCLRSTSVINDFVEGRIKNFDINKQSRFLYQIFYNNAVKFLHYLRQIDKASARVQRQLHKSMKNKEVIQLLELEKSLMYFSTSLSGNDRVLSKVGSLSLVKHYEDDDEILDDVQIENKQAMEMCAIYRDILSGTMDAYASIISNNQNTVMKFLASVTFIIAIPQLLASLWGMNTGVPFQSQPWGFWVVFGISIVISAISLYFMIKRKMF